MNSYARADVLPFFARLREATRDVWVTIAPTAAYACRTALAIGLALWVSAFCQLASPLSAVTTVLIVANPVSGALLSKSIWRIFGTLIGTTCGVLIMAAFPQQPLMFFGALAIVIGFACCIATLLRFYRAYAAVLSGYTIIIISTGAFADPDRIFLSAMGRLSVVTIGIISTAFVFQATSSSRSHTVLLRIHTTLRDILSQFVHLQPEHDDQLPRENDSGQIGAFRSMDISTYSVRARLLAQTNALIEAVEYAATDNYNIRQRAPALRLGITNLLGMLSAHHPAWRGLPGQETELLAKARSLSAGIMNLVSEQPPQTILKGDNGITAAHIAQTLEELRQLSHQARDPATLAAIDSECDLVMELSEAWACLSGNMPVRHVRLLPFFDWPAAFRNGVRGACVALLTGLIWYVLHWPGGPSMMVFVICASCLLSTAPSATKAATMLAGGMMMAIPASLFFQTVFLPRIDGFPLLWLSLFVCLLPGIWIQFHPRHSIRGFGYAVFFNVMTRVQNPVVFNDIVLFENYFAFALGGIILMLVFKVILPADHRLDCARLITSLTRSVRQQALAPAHSIPRWVNWEHTQMQKVLRLVQRLSFFAASGRAFEVTDAAFSAVSLGRVILRLRSLRKESIATGLDSTRMSEALSRALDSFSLLRSAPEETAACCRKEAQVILDGLGPETTGDDGHDLARRMAACLIQAAHLIDAAPGFFHKNGPMQRMADDPKSGESLRNPSYVR